MTVSIVKCADLRGDRKTGRYRQTQPRVAGHLGKIGPLATQQILHGLVAISLPATKKVYVFPGNTGLQFLRSLCHNVVLDSPHS